MPRQQAQHSTCAITCDTDSSAPSRDTRATRIKATPSNASFKATGVGQPLDDPIASQISDSLGYPGIDGVILCLMLAAKPINEVITCMRLTHAAQALMQGRPPSGTFVLVPPVARIRHAGTHETPPSCWNLYCGARGRWGFGCVAHIAARRPSWKTKGVSEKHHTRSSDLATKEEGTARSDQSLKVDARGIVLAYHHV